MTKKQKEEKLIHLAERLIEMDKADPTGLNAYEDMEALAYGTLKQLEYDS